jgi:hypothetical protein
MLRLSHMNAGRAHVLFVNDQWQDFVKVFINVQMLFDFEQLSHICCCRVSIRNVCCV